VSIITDFSTDSITTFENSGGIAAGIAVPPGLSTFDVQGDTLPGGPSVGLGSITKLRSPYEGQEDTAQIEIETTRKKYPGTLKSNKDVFREKARKLRYRLKELAGELLPDERVSRCTHFLGHGHKQVSVNYNEADGHAHYGGVAVCGSVWACPVCAAKIAIRRREELEITLQAARDVGLFAYLVTFTVQHDRGDALTGLLDDLNDAHRRTKAGKAWKVRVERYGIVGTITALEVRWSERAGWHPHKHAIFITTREWSEEEISNFQAWTVERYGRYLARHGRYVSPVYGVDVRGGDKAAAYVTKWGLEGEVTQGEGKGSKVSLSPFQLLEAYGDGDTVAGRLFQEYAQAVKGKQQLRYSRGLRDFLGLGAAASDQELAEKQEEQARPVVWLWPEQWRVVVGLGLLAELLTVTEWAHGDSEVIWAYLEGVGVPRFVEDRLTAAEYQRREAEGQLVPLEDRVRGHGHGQAVTA